MCHTEFGIVKNKRVIADKRGIDGVKRAVPNLVNIADRYGAKITFAVMPEVSEYMPSDIVHEIGLHIHAGWQEFEIEGIKFRVGDTYLKAHCQQSSTSTFLKDYPYEEQFEMIKKGKEYVEQAFGRALRVFVAGRWSLSNKTIRALIELGFTHDCSARAGVRREGFDWKMLSRIALPYYPARENYQKRGDLPILMVPVSQFFPHGIVSPELAPIVGLPWLKACFSEYYAQGVPLLHLCLHSPSMVDPYFISVMSEFLKFISKQRDIRFLFASQVREYPSVSYRANLQPYIRGLNWRIIQSFITRMGK